jgi:ABC-type bacteriocin/lantibiotic exporter with double-glycine peptidase domain
LVPFYSQFKDITSTAWQKVGCGVTSLAMIIDYYKPAVSVNTLLKQGIAAGAYDPSAGWTYKGLIALGNQYGLSGASYDLATLSSAAAFTQLSGYLQDGPVIVSVHYKFDPKSTIPHLVVIDGIVGDTLYYNDPAAKSGEKTISSSDFLKGWKKRLIVIRPEKETLSYR